MNDKELLTCCLLPHYWRILVEEKRIDGGFGHRLYWEWCDVHGNSSGGSPEIKEGKWEFFVDMFNGMGTLPTLRIGRLPDDAAFEKLRARVESE